MAEIIFPLLSYDIQGACFDVHNALRRFDLTEAGWETALAIALNTHGIAVQRQLELALHYKGRRVGRFFVDIIAEREHQVLLELKKVPLEPIHRAKVITYLRMTGIKLGMLISFAGDRVTFERLPNRVSERHERAADTDLPRCMQATGGQSAEQLWQVFCEVRNELGPGLMHMHYRRACQVEMRLRRMSFDKINEVLVHYRGQPVERHKLPMLVVDQRLLVAPLAVLQITPAIESRYRACLAFLELKQALIVNFRPETPEVVAVEVGGGSQ